MKVKDLNHVIPTTEKVYILCDYNDEEKDTGTWFGAWYTRGKTFSNMEITAIYQAGHTYKDKYIRCVGIRCHE